MNLRRLAEILEGDVCGDHVLAPGPGHTPHDRSLAVFLDPSAPDLFRTHSFAGDDFKTCRDYVKTKLGIVDSPLKEQERPITSKPAIAPSTTEFALTLWNESRSPRGSPIESYLASRGLSVAHWLDDSQVVRFHPACPFRLESETTVRLPAMIALFRDIRNDEPCGIHRTALRQDGRGKAELLGLGSPKKMLGRSKGAAIKLSPDSDVGESLAITEGIENGLTALTAHWRPVWCLGSAGAIQTFQFLPGIEALSIFTDADPAGIAAAKACRKRWQDAGRECFIILPPVDGQDWNDVARGAMT